MPNKGWEAQPARPGDDEWVATIWDGGEFIAKVHSDTEQGAQYRARMICRLVNAEVKREQGNHDRILPGDIIDTRTERQPYHCDACNREWAELKPIPIVLGRVMTPEPIGRCPGCGRLVHRQGVKNEPA